MVLAERMFVKVPLLAGKYAAGKLKQSTVDAVTIARGLVGRYAGLTAGVHID